MITGVIFVAAGVICMAAYLLYLARTTDTEPENDNS